MRLFLQSKQQDSLVSPGNYSSGSSCSNSTLGQEGESLLLSELVTKLYFSEGKKVEKSESSPKLPIRKFSPKLPSFLWSSDSYTKDKNPGNILKNLISTIPEPASDIEYEIQIPMEDFCTINENSSALQSQW